MIPFNGSKFWFITICFPWKEKGLNGVTIETKELVVSWWTIETLKSPNKKDENKTYGFNFFVIH